MVPRSVARRPDAFELDVRWHPSGASVAYLYRQGQLICRAADLADALGRDDLVTPNHVLDCQAGHVSMCPATEPVPSDGPVRELPEPTATQRVAVAVVDTGFVHALAGKSGYARFSAVTAGSRADAQVYADGTDRIQPYGGHGTAAAACLLAVAGAESTTVHVDSCLVGGAVDEVLAAHPDTVVVAAARNNGSDETFWPAASPPSSPAATPSGPARRSPRPRSPE